MPHDYIPGLTATLHSSEEVLAAILALEKTSRNSAPVLFEVMLQSVMSNSIHVTVNVIPLCLEYFFTPQIFFLAYKL